MSTNLKETLHDFMTRIESLPPTEELKSLFRKYAKYARPESQVVDDPLIEFIHSHKDLVKEVVCMLEQYIRNWDDDQVDVEELFRLLRKAAS